MTKTLTIDQKLAIVLSRGKSLRELAKEYGVHHSTIAEIYQESETHLLKYWTQKKQNIGRPSKKIQLQETFMEMTEQKKQLILKQIRIDYLELKIRLAEEKLKEILSKNKLKNKSNHDIESKRENKI